MRIRIGYELELDFTQPTATVFMLNVHPSQMDRLESPDLPTLTPGIASHFFHDLFGNPCVRVVAPAGRLSISADTIIRDSGEPEPWPVGIPACQPGELPDDTLPFLLPSRYCEVESLSDFAWSTFGHLPAGWSQVEAVLNWCKANVTFGYQYARGTKTAVDVFYERRGVCRDFMHLGITLCRALNIPARYATGYLGDIGVPVVPCAMDFFRLLPGVSRRPLVERRRAAQSAPHRPGDAGVRAATPPTSRFSRASARTSS